MKTGVLILFKAKSLKRLLVLGATVLTFSYAQAFTEPPKVTRDANAASDEVDDSIATLNRSLTEAKAKLDHAYQVATDNTSTLDAVIGAETDITDAKKVFTDAQTTLGDIRTQFKKREHAVLAIQCNGWEPITTAWCNSEVHKAQDQVSAGVLKDTKDRITAKDNEVNDDVVAADKALEAIQSAKNYRAALSGSSSSNSESSNGVVFEGSSSSNSSNSSSSSSSSSSSTYSSSSSSSDSSGSSSSQQGDAWY